MSIEELQRFKYPNLIAEFIESGYSICTLGDYMGLGNRRKEDDPEIIGKLRGEIKITIAEAEGLARLFAAEIEYLFLNKLETFGDMSLAFIRHYDSNVQKEKWLKEYKERDEIERILKEKPYLFEFMTLARNWTPEQVKQATALLKSMQ